MWSWVCHTSCPQKSGHVTVTGDDSVGVGDDDDDAVTVTPMFLGEI